MHPLRMMKKRVALCYNSQSYEMVGTRSGRNYCKPRQILLHLPDFQFVLKGNRNDLHHYLPT